MEPFAVKVRYRYSQADRGERDACFRGLFFDRSERAVLRRLRELHRLADRIEVVELLWLDSRPPPVRAAAASGYAAARCQ